jgi:hypothetical protein
MFDDIIGAEDIIGADVAFGARSELDAIFSGSRYPLVVGADGSQAPAMRGLEQNLAARHAAMVVPRQVTKAREYPLGFPTTTIAATTTTNVQASPQVPFRGRRLIIPSDFAGSILINDIKVGQASQFPASNPVPGRAFTELGVGVDLNMDTAQISQVVSLNVTNTSGGSVTFNAAIIGTTVL